MRILMQHIIMKQQKLKIQGVVIVPAGLEVDSNYSHNIF